MCKHCGCLRPEKIITNMNCPFGGRNTKYATDGCFVCLSIDVNSGGNANWAVFQGFVCYGHFLLESHCST